METQTKNYLTLVIDETGAANLRSKQTTFNKIVRNFGSVEQVKKYLTDRYGKLPKGKRKVYQDGKDGKATPVGFLHSFWNQDISHNSEKWFQTDWITVKQIQEQPLLIAA